jgi:hypothetical protein
MSQDAGTGAFEVIPQNQFGGTVLASKGGKGMRPTGVFLPPQFSYRVGQATVLLWFHGFYISGVRALFFKEATSLLRCVALSGKDVVLIAPFLGDFETATNTTYKPGDLGASRCEGYLDAVFGGLTAWYRSRLIDNDDWKPSFRIASLYLGGHSGGGVGLVDAAKTLGKYRAVLKECWFFDTLYRPASTWANFAKSNPDIPLYFYFGTGTEPAAKGDVNEFWRLVYGTPKHPRPGGPLRNVYLAPALPGAWLDMVAFQSVEEIRQKVHPTNPYERARSEADPLLDQPDAYWKALKARGLLTHYEVASQILAARLRQSLK